MQIEHIYGVGSYSSKNDTLRQQNHQLFCNNNNDMWYNECIQKYNMSVSSS